MLHIPHLESNVSVACQLSCVACNHLVPLWRRDGVWHADPEQIAADLGHLAKIVRAEAWGALGGEPLLNPRIVECLQAARASRVASKVEVWTNGLRLRKMPAAFWSSFDVLVLSVYEGKHDDESLEWIAAKAKDAGVELVVKDERTWHNFRTLLEPEPTDAAATRAKFAGCFFRSFSRVADRGFFFTCCCAPHMPHLLQGQPFGTDGIAIAGLTERRLRAYLDRAEPLGCCSICAGRDTAKPLEWTEQRDPTAWLKESAGR